MLRPFKMLASTALDALAEQYPLLKQLQSGRIVVPEAMIKEQLEKQMGDRPEIESVDLKCCDGYVELYVKTLKSGARHALNLRIEVETFLVTREEQYAVLRFPDNIELQSENLAGWFTRGIAASMVNRMAQSGDQAQEIAAKSNGLVELDWPLAWVHFGRHPQFQKYLMTRLGPLPSVLDVFEIRECRVEEGQIVLPVRRTGRAV